RGPGCSVPRDSPGRGRGPSGKRRWPRPACLPEQRVAAVVDAHGFLPLEADALRGRKFVLLRQDVAEAGVGLGVIFLEAEGLSVGGFCRGPLALLSQHVTEEAVAEGIIRAIANRPPEGGLGLSPLPLLLQDKAKVVVDRGVVRLEA